MIFLLKFPPILDLARHVCWVYHDGFAENPGAGPIAGGTTSCSRSARVAAGAGELMISLLTLNMEVSWKVPLVIIYF